MERNVFFLLAILSLCSIISGQSNDGAIKPTGGDNTSRRYSESRPFPRDKLSNKGKIPGLAAISLKTQAPKLISGGIETIEINSTLVTIPVSITDPRSGLYISDLLKEDFKIYEDGIEQEIAYFGVSEKPLTIILLLDTSPSTKYKIEEIQEAALAFVRELNLQDRVEVIKFNEKIRVLARATNKRQKINKAIEKARFDGGTSLYDVVAFALQERLKNVKGRKAIVLFTDGVDTTSEDSFYDDTVKQAEKSDAVIFPIFYDTYAKTLRKGSRSRVRELGKRKFGKMYLSELASLSGGRMVDAGSTSEELDSAFKAIADELRHQYNIGYYPINEGKPGQRKNIRVRVYRPDLNIRARDNYIVKARRKLASLFPKTCFYEQ